LIGACNLGEWGWPKGWGLPRQPHKPGHGFRPSFVGGGEERHETAAPKSYESAGESGVVPPTPSDGRGAGGRQQGADEDKENNAPVGPEQPREGRHPCVGDGVACLSFSLVNILGCKVESTEVRAARKALREGRRPLRADAGPKRTTTCPAENTNGPVELHRPGDGAPSALP